MHKDLQMQRINNVDLVHNFNYKEIDENCKLNIKVNTGNKLSNDKVNLEGISLEFEEVVVIKDARGRESSSKNIYQTGFLSEENLGEPLAYFDVNGNSYDFKTKISNAYYDNIKLNVYTDNISFLKEYEEMMLIMNEFNKYFLFEGEKPNKKKIIEKITKINELNLETEYNKLLKEVSSFYNSFITENISKDKEERALEILAIPEFQEGLKSYINNFNTKLNLVNVKETNSVRDVLTKKTETFNDMINTFENLINLREDYSNLKYTKGWQKRENNKSLKEIKKEFSEAKNIYNNLVKYQEKILKGTLSRDEVLEYTEKINEFEQKLDNSLTKFINLNAGFSFSEPLGIEMDRARYAVKMGTPPRYLDRLKEQFKDYESVFNDSKNLKAEFKSFIKDYKGIDPIKTSEQIRKEEAQMTESVDKLREVRVDYTNSLSSSISQSTKAIERLSKVENSTENMLILAKSIKSDIDNYNDYLYRMNVQSGTFELLRHITPAERLIVASIVDEQRKGNKESIIFSNQQEFIDSYLKYCKKFEDTTKKNNFNEKYNDYILLKDSNSSLRYIEDCLKMFEGESFRNLDDNLKDRIKLINNSYTEVLNVDTKIQDATSNLINSEIFKDFKESKEDGSITISVEKIDKANLSLQDKEYLKELINLSASKEKLDISKVVECLEEIKGIDTSFELKEITELISKKDSLIKQEILELDVIRDDLEKANLSNSQLSILNSNSGWKGIQEEINLLSGKLSDIEKGNLRDIKRMEYNIQFVNDLFMERLSSVNSEKFDTMFNNDFFKKYLPKDTEFEDLRKNLKTFFEFKNNLEKGLEDSDLNKLDNARLNTALAFIEKDCLAWRGDAINLEGYSSVDIFKRNELLNYSNEVEKIIKDLDSIDSFSEREKRDYLLNISEETKISFYDKYINDSEALSKKIESKIEKDSELNEQQLESLEKTCKIELLDESLKDVKFKRKGIFKHTDEIKKSNIDINKIYKEHISETSMLELDKISKPIVETINYQESLEDSKQIKEEFDKFYTLLKEKNIDIDGIGMIANTLYSEDGLNQFRYYMMQQGILTKDYIDSISNESFSRFVELSKNASPEEFTKKIEELKSLGNEGGHFDKLDYANFNINTLNRTLQHLSNEDRKVVYEAYEKFVAFAENRGFNTPLLKNSIDTYCNSKGFVVAANKEDSYILNFVNENQFIVGYDLKLTNNGKENTISFSDSEGSTIFKLLNDMKTGQSLDSEELKLYLKENLKHPEECTEAEVLRFIKNFKEIVNEFDNTTDISCNIRVNDTFESQVAETLRDYKAQDRLLVNFRFMQDKYIPLEGEFIEHFEAGRANEYIDIYKTQLTDNLKLDKISIEDLSLLSKKFEDLERDFSKDRSLEGLADNFVKVKEKELLNEVSQKLADINPLEEEEIDESIEPLKNKLLEFRDEYCKEFEASISSRNREDIKKLNDFYGKINNFEAKVIDTLDENSKNINEISFLLQNKDALKEIIINSDDKTNFQELIDSSYKEIRLRMAEDTKLQYENDTFYGVVHILQKLDLESAEARESILQAQQLLMVINDSNKESYETIIQKLQNRESLSEYSEVLERLDANIASFDNIKGMLQTLDTLKEEEKEELRDELKNELIRLEEDDHTSYESILYGIEKSYNLDDNKKEILSNVLQEIQNEKDKELVEREENINKIFESLKTYGLSEEEILQRYNDAKESLEIEETESISNEIEDEDEKQNDSGFGLNE